MSKVYLTRFKKSLKLFKEFNNEVKGINCSKTIQVSRDGKGLIKDYNDYLYRFMFDMTQYKIV